MAGATASTGSGPRWRRRLSTVAMVAAAVVFPLGLLANWAQDVLFDSASFADRSVSMLQSQAVRQELADRLTEELARSGNQTAVNFRPAFQLAVEAAIDTDTFQSIFRTAVYRTHSAIVATQGATDAPLDLSDTVSIIVANLSLPSSAATGQAGSGGLDDSLSGLTRRLSDWRVWSLEDDVGLVSGLGILGGLALAGAAVVLSTDRRRTLRRLGWCVLGGGLVLAALVPLAQWIVSSRISDGALRGAVSAGLGQVMADLRTIGLWVAAYGLLLAAAARRTDTPRPTPARAWAGFRSWADRTRSSTPGSVVLGLGALVLGVLVVSEVGATVRVLVVVGGVWLSYFGITELTGLARFAPAVTGPAVDGGTLRWRSRRVLALTAVVVVVALLFGVGAFLTTRQAARTAAAAGVPECNGEAALCDVPLNAAMFAGSHNAMSSPLYPGWLFAEQTGTLADQLDAGVRALLIDTHYGIPSSARLPGSETPVVLSDRAAELAVPPGDSYDPAIAARAQQIAANAPAAANAERGIYLCHNFCEMGAVSFLDQMTVVRQWLETHPDEVVIMIIEDHTQPAETAADLEAAGLADRAWTLDPTAPIPTFGDLVDAGRNLLVFAENGGPGSPDWYQQGYSWFQETPYTWSSTDEMTCAPNRGSADNPFMLINHWVGYSPPDPGRAGSQVNSEQQLTDRIRRCIDERGVFPNVVAVDFAQRGALMATVERFNSETRRVLADVGAASRRGTPGATASTTTAPAADAPTTTAPDGSTDAFTVPTPVTALTGGNPTLFCASAPAFVRTMSSWALADLSRPARAAGLPALTFGPLVVRQVTGLQPSAPTELARQFGPALEQAQAAVDAVQAAGLTPADVDALADAAADQLAGEDPDPALVEQRLVELLRDRLGADATVALAASFGTDRPTEAAVFDLGDVSDEVAAASGYGCLVQAG